MRVNLSAAESYDALPAGRYHVKVTDGELNTSESEEAKHPGSKYINWELTVQSGEHENRKLWTNTTISHGDCDCNDEDKFNKSLGGIVGLLKATGAATDEDLDSEDFELDIDDVIGRDAMAVVTVSKYQGEDRNNVKRFRSVGDLANAESSLLP